MHSVYRLTFCTACREYLDPMLFWSHRKVARKYCLECRTDPCRLFRCKGCAQPHTANYYLDDTYVCPICQGLRVVERRARG